MNRQIIRELKRERRKLYPYGLPIEARGSGKTMLHLSHVLRYFSFQVAIDFCKKSEKEVTMDSVRKIMNDFIDEMWPF